MRIQIILTALERERSALATLLRLARLQQRAMVRGRVSLLAGLGRRISHAVVLATEARETREAEFREIAVSCGLPAHVHPRRLLEGLPPLESNALERALQRVHGVAATLRRQNFQNHQLAAVSTDLVREQLALLVGGTEGPDARYSAHAPEGVTAGLSGLVNGRA